jgi:hypothetical protein
MPVALLFIFFNVIKLPPSRNKPSVKDSYPSPAGSGFLIQ